MRVRFRRVDWEFSSVFRIAYRTQTHSHSVLVELEDDQLLARGEGLAVSYRGDTIDSMLDQVASVANSLEAGISARDLQALLPAGGARNAIDCALWDLDAKRARKRIWTI